MFIRFKDYTETCCNKNVYWVYKDNRDMIWKNYFIEEMSK